jgi:competence protein ComEA
MRPDGPRRSSLFDADEESSRAGEQSRPEQDAGGKLANWLRANASAVLFGVALVAALAGGFTWLAVRPAPRRVEIVIPAPAPVVVQVSGAVGTPGVYTLQAGSRVADAIAAAGGFSSAAAADSVNQAAKLADGARVDVPVLANPSRGSEADGPATAQGPPGLTDLNTATVQELESLPGIGPTLAAAIIDFRSKNGPITRVDQLLAVDGLGPKKIEAIRPFLVQQ